MLLAASKRDLSDELRQVTTKEGEDLAKELGIQFFEVSAKNDENISELMEVCAKNYLEYSQKAGKESEKRDRKHTKCILS